MRSIRDNEPQIRKLKFNNDPTVSNESVSNVLATICQPKLDIVKLAYKALTIKIAKTPNNIKSLVISEFLCDIWNY